jgi:hypothetical protein
MRWNWQSVVVYVLVALVALGLNASFAQSAQERVSAAHELVPAGDGFGPYEVDGMGPDPAPAGYGGYDAAIADACGGEGGCVGWMTRVIGCESGWDEGAWSPNPNGGSDVGLLQINDATWGNIAYADGVSQIYWAADMYRAGLSYHWVCG